MRGGVRRRVRGGVRRGGRAEEAGYERGSLCPPRLLAARRVRIHFKHGVEGLGGEIVCVYVCCMCGVCVCVCE